MYMLFMLPDLFDSFQVLTPVYQFDELLVSGCVGVLFARVLRQLSPVVYVVNQFLIDVVWITQHVNRGLQNWNIL